MPWIAWLVPVTLTLIGLIVLVTTRQIAYPADAWGFRGYSAIFALTGATVGAIVLAHRPGNVIGRLFITIGVLASFQLLSEEYLAVGVIAAPGSLPAVEWLAWSMNWLWIPQFVIMVVFFLIFPDGHLISPRWRAVLALAVIAGAIGVLAAAFMPGPLTDFKRVSNPIGFASAAQYGPAVAAFRAGILAAFLLAAWSLVIRYRSAGPVERLQLRWVAFAATIAAVLAPLGFIEQEGTQAVFILALCGLPVAAGVAILRYHLFEIDLLINRTLVYVTLTAILAGIYTASVTLMQRLFIALTGERSDAVFVLTTLVVVVVFTPVKNALQSVVDRRFKEIRDPTAPLGGLRRPAPGRPLAARPRPRREAPAGRLGRLAGRLGRRRGARWPDDRSDRRGRHHRGAVRHGGRRRHPGHGGRRPPPGRGAIRGPRSDRPRCRGRRGRGGPGGPAGRRARGADPREVRRGL